MSERVEELDIGKIAFSKTDGVFFFVGPQVEYLRANANASLDKATFFSLALQTRAEILKRPPAKTVSHDDFITYPDMKAIRDVAAAHDRTWLASLGCSFGVMGLDFAELDALCQYSFFRYVTSVDLIARRMIEAHPEIERFFVIRGPEPLPLDFDFDSDLGQAVIRHICEEIGRPVVEIVTREHQVTNGPHFLRRPFSKGWAAPSVMGMPQPHKPYFHVGFIPSTVPSALRIIRDATALNCAQILFYSPWPVSAPRVTTDEQEEERLTPEDKAWEAGIAHRLAELRIVIGQRLERSVLPPAIAGNRHLAFQWDHIITKRWVTLAAMARAAAAFAQIRPLDIFINPEMANWEGMILSGLYRRAGTKILIAPHSGWPIDNFDSSWRPGDWAMVYSRLGKIRLREISGLDRIYSVGAPWIAPPRAPDWERLLAEKRRILDGRKLVIHITSPSEVSFTPILDQKAHLAQVSALGRVPAHLADQVMVAIRRRSAGGSEDDSIYGQLAGFDDEALHFLDGLTFHDCVELADCVVGINIPTSGYYEVFQAAKPLIHLQGTKVLYMQPDLPAEVISRIDRAEDLWPAIERILFDEAHRAALLDIQARFLAEDLQADFDIDESPVQSLLDLMLTQDS